MFLGPCTHTSALLHHLSSAWNSLPFVFYLENSNSSLKAFLPHQQNICSSPRRRGSRLTLHFKNIVCALHSLASLTQSTPRVDFLMNDCVLRAAAWWGPTPRRDSQSRTSRQGPRTVGL